MRIELVRRELSEDTAVCFAVAILPSRGVAVLRPYTEERLAHAATTHLAYAAS
jgi:hypothetical protein